MLIDAKPLPVGTGKKDPDAAAGHAGAGKGKGYKLCMICDSRRIPIAWTVVAMNHNEEKIAPELVACLPVRQRSDLGMLTGDTAYDNNLLHDLTAERGWVLYVPRKQGEGFGHCRHSPWRILVHRGMPEWWRAQLGRLRKTVERCFAHLARGTLGLKPLPLWARGLRCVQQLTQAKIIIYLMK